MANTVNVIEGPSDKILARAIQQSSVEVPVGTILETDERVIARVTDGIYRQPGSALRELISNAYDADATEVIIKTDAPRFSRISIQDNGHGMSPDSLAYMLKHIGGSSKRVEAGKDLGVTSFDANKSPKGRDLIGKIGIGIFSVSQLTQTFQIITKTKGDNFRTIANINLKHYSDTDEEKYESGLVTIWREKASDTEVQGTTIVLNNIRAQAKDTLQTKEIWTAIESGNSDDDIENTIVPPKYHIGKVLSVNKDDSGGNIGAESNVPWASTDSPKEAFAALVDAVWRETELGNQSPKLENLFDYYLKMIWDISLAAPLPYVYGHLFDKNLSDWSFPFLISNEPRGNAKPIENANQSIRDILELTDDAKPDEFNVFIDDLQLQRPIRYTGLPTGGHRLNKPVILIGKCSQTFPKIDVELSGGTLKFEAYLFWNPRIAPIENRGSLIRIHNASGTLFDSSFMHYQVSELTRLRQITCEIFIHEGFDSALNIDRESFNFAHTHAVYLARWLHGAIRQLSTAQKRLAAEVRLEARVDLQSQYANEVQKLALDVWKRETRDNYSFPPSVAIAQGTEELNFQKNDVILIRPEKDLHANTRKLNSLQYRIVNEQIKAITQILASFGVLEKLAPQEQQRLLNSIYAVLETTE